MTTHDGSSDFIIKHSKGALPAITPTVLLVDRSRSAYRIKRRAFRLGWTLAEIDGSVLWAFAPTADLDGAPTVSIDFDEDGEIDYAMLGTEGVTAPKLNTILDYLTESDEASA